MDEPTKTYAPKHVPCLSWVRIILNPLMLWGAGLGIFIFIAVTKMQDASNHRGSVAVDFEIGERRLTEAEYKRHEYSNAGVMIFIASTFWVIIAKHSQKVKPAP